MAAERKLHVMIVDDVALYRKILKDLLSELNIIDECDTAINGEIALMKINANPPDLVLLDVDMPGKDGLETLIEIKQKHPHIGVIMVSGITKRQAAITVEALRIGAIDFVPKPLGNDLEANMEVLRHRLYPLIEHFGSRKVGYQRKQKDAPPPTPPSQAQGGQIAGTSQTQGGQIAGTSQAQGGQIAGTSQDQGWQIADNSQDQGGQIKRTRSFFPVSRSTEPLPTKVNKNLPRRIDVLCVGVSTGGPGALHKFIPMLPADLGVPVLLVQHMPADFTKSLAEHLNMKSKIEVVEAENGEVIVPNKVYIAPGGKHMIVERHGITDTISIIDSPPVQSCKPSVDVLFQSIPNVYPGNILAVIMTGMGADGLDGMRKIQNYSHYCITQSESSCIVYGMPRSIDEAILSDESVHLDRLAERVVDIIKYGKWAVKPKEE